MSQYVGYVYKITNKLNGKIYVGKRQKPEFDKYYWGSCVHIENSINKYGIDNFSRDVLQWCHNIEELNDRERYWITLLDARNPDVGYNLALGGDGSDIGGKRNSLYGYVHNDVEVLRVLKSQISLYLSEGYKKGRGYNGLTGHQQKESTKQKIRESNTGKHNHYGENNPCYGSRFQWINNGLLNKRLNLNEKIPDGYVKGKIQKQYIRTNNQLEWDKKRSQSGRWVGDNNPSRQIKGRKWYNDGVREILSVTKPEGFVKGRLCRGKTNK